MEVLDELNRIVGAKDSLIGAIEAKGVSVPDSAQIDELPGYIAQIDTGIKLVKLWTNPDPGSAFTAQTLALSLGSYDMYVVSAARSITDAVRVSSMVKVGESVSLQVAGETRVGEAVAGKSYVGFWMATRQVTYSGGSLIIADASISGSTENDFIVPVAIYGIKGAMIV